MHSVPFPGLTRHAVGFSVMVQYALCCHQHPQLSSGKLCMSPYSFNKYLLKTTRSPRTLR